MSFTVSLTTVLVMLLYAVPGYVMMKARLLKPDGIAPLVTLLLYLCAPLQTVYAMQQIEYSTPMLRSLGLCFVLSLLLMGLMLAGVYLALLRRQEQIAYRICTIATACGNVGFIGIPLLEALLPGYPQAVAYSAMFSLTMNILMWTAGSAIITRDRRYMSARKIFLNPMSIAMAVSLILFFGRIHLAGQPADMVTLLGQMATPVCMLIMGMRLALVPVRPIFTRPLQYLAVALKMVVLPLIALAVCSLLPVEKDFTRSVFILCCVPAANVVLSFAELLGEGQDVAVNVVLLSTLLSLGIIPLMMQVLGVAVR